MTAFIAIVFGLTYVGMALGRIPGLRVDRSGIAMIAAVVLVGFGALPGSQVAAAIHFPTLLLLGGLMILSGRVNAAGVYEAAAVWIARRAGHPLRLLALTIAVGGVLAALLFNDIVVFAMAPLLCTGLTARGPARGFDSCRQTGRCVVACTHGCSPVLHFLGDNQTRSPALAVTQDRDRIAALRRSAIACHEGGRTTEAVRGYRRYLEAVPGDAAIWARMALALDGDGSQERAIDCLRRALEIDPGNPEYLNNLGIILIRLHRVDEALQAHEQMIERRPDSVTMRFNYGVTLRECGRVDEALAVFDAVTRSAPENPHFQVERALALLLLGRYEEGFTAFEWRWRLGRLPGPPTKAARWKGEDIAGKRLLIYPEQGLGDSIMISRYFPMLKARGAEVVFYCNPPLTRLYETAAGIDEIVEMGHTLPEVDLCCPILSLPHLLGTTLDSIPPQENLAADPADVAAWQDRFEAIEDLKVGLVWAGNPSHKNDRNRSIPLDTLLPLLAVPGARFFSLQKDMRSGDEAESLHRHGIIDLGPELADFRVTAAIVSALDLVVSVDTSVVHVAAALGRPVWVLLPFLPDWRWLLGRENTPWHPSARLFRQAAAGDWEGVVRSIRQELEKAVTERSIGR